MEYNKLKLLKNKLLSDEGGLLHNKNNLNDPISKYNFFVDVYNKDFNLINSTKMENINRIIQKIYSYGFKYQNDRIYCLFAFFKIPLILYFTPWDKIYKMYLLILLINSVIIFLIFMYAKNIFTINEENIPNPFLNMIFNPELCKLVQLHNLETECRKVELTQFNLTEFQLNLLMKRNRGGKIKFTIYDQNLIDIYAELGKSHTVLLRHIFCIMFVVTLLYLEYM